MTVELLTDPTTEELAEAVEAFQRLVPQLSKSAPAVTREQVERVLTQPGVYQFLYRPTPEAGIYGLLSLATFEIPTGLRAWIEDVVVDESMRGRGAGEALVRAAVEYAAELGARTVDLTSRPTREAANRLYKRCGFKLRETNVYRADAPVEN